MSLIHPPSQIGNDMNLTLIKLLVLVVSFTGVFRTTCVPEEGEPAEPGDFEKPRWYLLLTICICIYSEKDDIFSNL